MGTQPELERYLAKLSTALGPIPVDEKAEIIMEIKSHVLDALERDASATLSSVLNSLGEPEVVANKYLLDKGLSPVKPPKHPVIKWLVIGFLGTMALTILPLLLIIWKASPIIHVDEEKGHIQILGGLIEVNEDTSIGGGNSSGTVSGELTTETNTVVKVHFSNGKMEILPTSQRTLTWNCKVHGSHPPVSWEEVSNEKFLDLSGLRGSKCRFSIPQDLTLQMEGANGKVSIHEPRFHIDLKIDNGVISFAPASQQQYNVKTSIVNGATDNFPSSTTSDAYKVALKVVNGSIKRASR